MNDTSHEVVCVYHFRRERAFYRDHTFPKYGNIYTVLDEVNEDNGSWLVLEEIENHLCWHGGWWKERFIPIKKLKLHRASKIHTSKSEKVDE